MIELNQIDIHQLMKFLCCWCRGWRQVAAPTSSARP